MSLSETVSTRIFGLDLALGGGLRRVRRLANDRASATVLVRGGAGVGKTLLAARLAVAVAKETQTDALFACVEILPTELQAQFDGFSALRAMPFTPRFDDETKGAEGPRLRSALLPLEDHEGEPDALPRCLADALDQSEARGLRIGVLVVDSLSDGYGFGANADRVIVDSVCKLAVERGIVLLLVEEAHDRGPSPWSFSVDTVLELTARDAGPAEHGRVVSVTKHRFARSNRGPHALVIRDERLDVVPEISTYLTVTPEELFDEEFASRNRIERRWNVHELDDKDRWPRDFSGSVVSIAGVNMAQVVNVARLLGNSRETGSLFVRLDSLSSAGVFVERKGNTMTVRLTAGLLAPESLCDRVIAILRSEAAHKRGTQRVVIGDLASLHRVKRRADQEEALVVLGTILQRAQIPLVLYETVALEPLTLPSGSSFGLARPIAADVADVELRLHLQTVEPRKTAQGSSALITTSRIEAVDLRSGNTIPLDLGRSAKRGFPAPPAAPAIPPPRW